MEVESKCCDDGGDGEGAHPEEVPVQDGKSDLGGVSLSRNAPG